MVDSDDIRQGLLVRRFLGKGGRQDLDEEEGEDGDENGRAENGSAWGPRGISVSADDGVQANGHKRDEEQGLTDPQAFEDDDFDDDPDLGPEEHGVISNGSEWRDNDVAK